MTREQRQIIDEVKRDLERALTARFQEWSDAGFSDLEIAKMALAHIKQGIAQRPDPSGKIKAAVRALEHDLYALDPDNFPLTQ
jgi:hypothetical protein